MFKMNNTVLFQKKKIPLQIILFICLIQSIWTATLDDLKCVCDIRNASTSNVIINKLPIYCTAAATSQNVEGDVKKMSTLKSNTPFIIYFNGFSYEEWGTYLSYEKQFIAYMKDHNLDGIIFDKMHRGIQFDKARNQAIYLFFKNLKQSNPQKLFGLALPKDASVLPNAFDYRLLDPMVDFYVIQTINYRPCEFRTVMKRTSTVGDMKKSLDALQPAIPNMGKVLLTVQVYSIGITSQAKNGPTLISYSEMCHYNNKELSKNRKYCKDSIKTLWEKGKLVNEYGMLGVYIQHIDYDDFAGSCDCEIAKGSTKHFPATAAIISGTLSDPSALEPDDCSDFGDYDETSASSTSDD